MRTLTRDLPIAPPIIAACMAVGGIVGALQARFDIVNGENPTTPARLIAEGRGSPPWPSARRSPLVPPARHVLRRACRPGPKSLRDDDLDGPGLGPTDPP